MPVYCITNNDSLPTGGASLTGGSALHTSGTSRSGTALIIEDEPLAVQQLTRQLAVAAPAMQVIGVLQSVEETVEWFRSAEERYPDVVFMDIHLADGLAFRIFDNVEIRCPIIFTTAYDQYALKAFRVNSIDYLLKPISPDDLKRALGKLEALTSPLPEEPAPSSAGIPLPLQHAIEMISQHYRQYKRLFLIPYQDKLIPLEVDNIACIYLDNNIGPDGHHAVQALTSDGQTYRVEGPLDQIMTQLDPAHFFRVNRQYIVAHNAIKDITVWLLGKYSLTLTVPTPERIIVPKARVAQFKEWYSNF